ncbi:MAG TPA: MerR family transcriptional regulator [Chthoniobacterales bacterium]|nr:MerR family transcriptional regulator [Chthoniobacterales bacterium]
MNVGENGELVKVGALAAQAGVRVQTLRFYEDLGLLPKARRSLSNHRLYSSEVFRRVQFIKKAQALGFSLDEIKEIFVCQQRGGGRCRCVLQLGESRLRELESQLEVLQGFRQLLTEVLPKWRKKAKSRASCAGEFCDLLEELPALLASSPATHRGGINR